MPALNVFRAVLDLIGAILAHIGNGTTVQGLRDIPQVENDAEMIIHVDLMGTIISGAIWRRAVGTIVR